MIIRESEDTFTFITQHEHANIAGEFFTHLKKDFIPTEHYESLKFAIYQHDRSWIIPDTAPLMDDMTKKPYDFTNYPDHLKFHFYRLGIEQTDQVNSYSALLCSMHYAAFIDESSNEAGKAFRFKEIQRQKHLLKKLDIQNINFLNYQLQVLQFCDHISLYVCLNKPGVDKEHEHPFYINGFDNSAFFNSRNENNITAYYADRNVLKFNSNPFANRFEIKINYKKVLKKDIKKLGLCAAYLQQATLFNTIKIG